MFEMFLPTKIISGENCVSKNASALALGKSCLIITGKNSAKKSGALDDVTAALCSLGIEYSVFDRVRENPLISDCHEAGDIARERGCDFIIGIGGGSPLDSAKAVAAFAANRVSAHEDIYDALSSSKSALPVIAIPTTGGTGSEANSYSVLSIENNFRKKTLKGECLYPKVSFVDPKYTYSLSRDYTVSCALDAMCHTVEAYLSPSSTAPYSLFALWGGRLVWRALCALDSGGEITKECREMLSSGSLSAGAAIGRCGTGFTHPLGYSLSLYDGVPHGRACAAFTGEYVRYNMKCDEGKRLLDEFCGYIGTTPEEFAEKMPQWAAVELCFDESDIKKRIDPVEGASNYKNSPYVITRTEMNKIYSHLF